MKPLSFTYKDSCLVDEKTIENYSEKIFVEIEYLQDQIGNGYATNYGFINLPSDFSLQQEVFELVTKKKETEASIFDCLWYWRFKFRDRCDNRSLLWLFL
jgi:hypothetical protein